MPIGHQRSILEPPNVLTCPGCGVRFEVVDEASGTTRITILGRDEAWTPPTFAPPPGVWRALSMIFLLREFAARDGERFGIPRRRREVVDLGLLPVDASRLPNFEEIDREMTKAIMGQNLSTDERAERRNHAHPVNSHGPTATGCTHVSEYSSSYVGASRSAPSPSSERNPLNG